MKKYLGLLILLLAGVSFAQTTDIEKEQKQWQQQRFLAKEKDVLINGIIPAQNARVAQIIAFFGKPKVIGDITHDCNYVPDRIRRAKKQQIYYYDNEKTGFFVYDDRADLFAIDLSTKKYTLKTKKITLTHQTTLDELLKVFPALKLEPKYNIGNYSLQLTTSKKIDNPYYYELLFKNNKLKVLTIEQDAC